MLTIAGQSFKSRLLLGTAQYPSLSILEQAIRASKTEIITVSIRRQSGKQQHSYFWDLLQSLPCQILPNTAGCLSAKEAIITAELARELFNTNWIKLEVIGDDYTLQADPFELLKATKILIQQGFEVLPYCSDDLILCQRLVELGCQVLMPWAAPIGSAQGILNPYALSVLRDRLPDTTLIIDAGIGKPSHACTAMEMGYDAVLLNSAVALSHQPIQMARAFSHAIQAGRDGFEAGLIPTHAQAQASTPTIGKPIWQDINYAE